MTPIRNAISWSCLTFVLVGCSTATREVRERAVAISRGLEYLRATEGEFGLDVVVMVEIVGDTIGDPRAAAIVSARRPTLRAADLSRFEPLLGASKPRFPPASPDPAAVDDSSIDPEMTLRQGETMDAWLADVLRCRIGEDAARFVLSDDRWGRVLTHQATWLLFAHWAGCTVPFDMEARRRQIASRLLAESRFDPHYSETFLERLAVLGHLGFGAAIEPAWIDELLRAQRDDGGWGVAPGARSHPHPTGLALWTLANASRPER